MLLVLGKIDVELPGSFVDSSLANAAAFANWCSELGSCCSFADPEKQSPESVVTAVAPAAAVAVEALEFDVPVGCAGESAVDYADSVVLSSG